MRVYIAAICWLFIDPNEKLSSDVALDPEPVTHHLPGNKPVPSINPT